MEFEAEKVAIYKRWATDNKRVVAVVKPQPNLEDTVEIDGEIKAAHIRGIMIRPRGRMQPELIAPENLVSIDLFEQKPKPITEKRLAHIAYGNIRQHLADRHGMALEDINAETADENWAYDEHEKEHAPTAPKMSHYHEG